MDSPLALLTTAILLIFLIYKGAIFVLGLFPDSAFWTFVQSICGKVLVAVISPIILWLIFVLVAVNVLHIQC